MRLPWHEGSGNSFPDERWRNRLNTLEPPLVVQITDVGPRPDRVMAELYEWLRSGMKEVQELVESMPGDVPGSLAPFEAELLCLRLRETGASLSLCEANSKHEAPPEHQARSV